MSNKHTLSSNIQTREYFFSKVLRHKGFGNDRWHTPQTKRRYFKKKVFWGALQLSSKQSVTKASFSGQKCVW